MTGHTHDIPGAVEQLAVQIPALEILMQMRRGIASRFWCCFIRQIAILSGRKNGAQTAATARSRQRIVAIEGEVAQKARDCRYAIAVGPSDGCSHALRQYCSLFWRDRPPPPDLLAFIGIARCV